MIKKRIRAFTIMELTIAMLMSAIVIGITYSMYAIISRSYLSYHNKNEEMATVLRLDELLRKDFDRSQSVFKDLDGIKIVKLSGNIRYKFDPDYVLRLGIKPDTFKVKTDSVNMFFENSPISELSDNEELNRLDELDLSLLLQNEKITYHYRKVYSSLDLFNRKPNALH